MTQYKGYYIDHIHFHSKAEIDAHIKQQAVEAYQRLIRYFADHSTMAVSIKCSEEADRLHNIFGFSYEEIEDLEIAAYAAWQGGATLPNLINGGTKWKICK